MNPANPFGPKVRTGPLFDSENYESLVRNYVDLMSYNPRHWYLVCCANAYSLFQFSKPIVITSIFRQDDQASVHYWWRGTDIRIKHQDRLTNVELEGLDIDEAHELATHLNRAFTYGRPGSQCALIHGDGLHQHIHLQTPQGEAWK